MIWFFPSLKLQRTSLAVHVIVQDLSNLNVESIIGVGTRVVGFDLRLFKSV